jgi:hypothetical protein
VENLSKVSDIHSFPDFSHFIHRDFHRLEWRLVIDFMAIIYIIQFSTAPTTTTKLIHEMLYCNK